MWMFLGGLRCSILIRGLRGGRGVVWQRNSVRGWIIEEIIGECERQIGERRFEFDIR